jgi:hypothetical protein
MKSFGLLIFIIIGILFYSCMERIKIITTKGMVLSNDIVTQEEFISNIKKIKDKDQRNKEIKEAIELLEESKKSFKKNETSPEVYIKNGKKINKGIKELRELLNNGK